MHLFNRPGIGEAMASVICVMAVLGTLVAVDGRVRDRFSAVVSEASADPVRTVGARVAALSGAIAQAARDNSIDQAPLLVFTVIAAALLIFMLRT